MIKYKWIICQMIVKPSENNLTNVVAKVYWRRQAIAEPNGVLNVYEEKGETDCPMPDASSFTNYDSLTESEVSSWIESIIDMKALDAKLDKGLDELINPKYPVVDLPWDIII
jgi:hypothetical protein